MNDQDLERLVDRELKRLPTPRAPRTLLPRVMTAVAEPRMVPWYSRPWLTWPRGLQVLSAAIFVGLVWGGGVVWSQGPLVVQWAGQMAAVSRTLWNVLFGPIAFVVLGLTVIVALACAAAWTAVSRVTFGEASPQ